MPAVVLQPVVTGYNPASFGAFLTSQKVQFEIDLQGAPLTRVLEECDKYKQVKGEVSSLSSVIHNIQKIEDDFKTQIPTEMVTDFFYANFVQYLFANGCVPSTINTYCNQLRSALKWGVKHHCTVSSTYDEFKPIPYRPDKIALTPDEVSHIYHFDINTVNCRPQHKRTLERVRDMFVLSCNLGQRHGDMVRINPNHFDATRTKFTIIQEKTKSKAVVNLTNMVIDRNVTREILEKYNYTAPYSCCISAFNRNLHELLFLIGQEFLSDKQFEYEKNGDIVTVVKKRWELVASHTARRTFITYHILRGITEVRVRRCSGHTDSRSFARYIRFQDDDD